MKRQMTSRERILAAARCEEVDHVPLGQLFHSTIMETPPDRQWANQFERAQVMKDLSLDPTIDIWLPSPEAPPNVPVRKWMEDDPDGPDPLLCAEYETPAGNLVQKVRRTARDWYHHTHYSFMPTWDRNAHRPVDRFDRLDLMDDFFTTRYKVPLVRGPEDLDAFEHLLQPPSGGHRDLWLRNALKAKKIADQMQLATQARRVAVGDWFMWVCLFVQFCKDMIKRPEYVERFYDIISNYNRQIIDMVLEVEPDIVQYRGWYDTPDYWGPDRLRDTMAPRIQALAKQAHDGGAMFCYLLPEGYTVYRDILRELDVDVFLGLDPLAARKAEDLAVVKEAIGDRHCIWGGVNACVTVGTRSDEEIDQAARTAIETLGPRGLILNASMYFYDDDVTWDRLMVFVDAWKKYAGVG